MTSPHPRRPTDEDDTRPMRTVPGDEARPIRDDEHEREATEQEDRPPRGGARVGEEGPERRGKP